MQRENKDKKFIIKMMSTLMLLVTIGSVMPTNLIASVVEQSLPKNQNNEEKSSINKETMQNIEELSSNTDEDMNSVVDNVLENSIEEQKEEQNEYITGDTTITRNEVINVPDNNLKKILNRHIDSTRPANSEIYTSEIAGITRMVDNTKNVDVSNLEGLQYATSLERLQLNAKGLRDVGPIANLQSLQHITFINSDISDISVMEKNENLTHFALQPEYPYPNPFGSSPETQHDNNTLVQIADRFPNLERLNLPGYLNGDQFNAAAYPTAAGKITDISPVAKLDKLKNVNLSANSITDFSPLVDTVDVGLSYQQYFFLEDAYFDASVDGSKIYAMSVPSMTDIFGNVTNGKRLGFRGQTPNNTYKIKGATQMIDNNIILLFQTVNTTATPPTINAEDREVNVGDVFNPLEGVTATDKADGSIALTNANVIRNEVNTTIVGVYEVEYSVTDSSGLTTTKVINVTVRDLPIINAEDVVIVKGDGFDPLDFVTATDAVDGTITLTDVNVISNNVNPAVPGVYQVVYSVTNSNGGTTTKTIMVTVLEIWTIQYDLQGGTLETETNVTEFNETTPEFEIHNPTKQGYTFTGWEVASSLTLPFVDPVYTNLGNDVSISEGTTGHKLFRATWTPNTDTPYLAEYYTRNLDGTYSLQETDNLVGTTDKNVQIMIKNFVGFTAEPTHIDAVPSGNVNADGSLVLKMYYTRNIYDVTYDSDGGSLVESESVEFDTLITEPTQPTKNGYTFAGWYKESELINEWNFTFDKMPSNDITLYAKWTVNFYNISFDSNTGTGTMSDILVNQGDTILVPNSTFTKVGYKATHWNTKADGTGKTYNFGDILDPMIALRVYQGDIVLYAQWEALPVEVLPPTTGEPPVEETPKKEELYETGIYNDLGMFMLLGCILISLFLIRKSIARNVD